MTGAGIVVDTVRGEVVAAVRTHGGRLLEVATTEPVDLELLCDEQGLGAAESFEISRTTGRTLVRSADGPGLLYGLHHVLRLGAAAFAGEAPARRHDGAADPHAGPLGQHRPAPGDGQVERGYAGGSIFYDNGRVRSDLGRVRAYARMLGSIGVNHLWPMRWASRLPNGSARTAPDTCLCSTITTASGTWPPRPTASTC